MNVFKMRIMAPGVKKEEEGFEFVPSRCIQEPRQSVGNPTGRVGKALLIGLSDDCNSVGLLVC